MSQDYRLNRLSQQQHQLCLHWSIVTLVYWWDDYCTCTICYRLILIIQITRDFQSLRMLRDTKQWLVPVMCCFCQCTGETCLSCLWNVNNAGVLLIPPKLLIISMHGYFHKQHVITISYSLSLNFSKCNTIY